MSGGNGNGRGDGHETDGLALFGRHLFGLGGALKRGVLPTRAEMVRAAIEAHKAEQNARDAALADRLDQLAEDAHALAGELRGRALSGPPA